MQTRTSTPLYYFKYFYIHDCILFDLRDCIAMVERMNNLMTSLVFCRCETDIDECETNPCSNNATCVDGNNTFTCACPSNFTGSACQFSVS